jgi:hypothetical protein
MRNILNFLKKWTFISQEPTTQVNPPQETTPKTNATAKNKKYDDKK